MENTYIIIGIIVILFIIVLIQYNKIVKLKMKVKQSKSGIDVYCQQRFDLIPNLVETVKGYTSYEKETLERITELRTRFKETKDLKIGEELNNKLNTIIAVAENNPDLKASEQFLNLQKNLSKVESQLQAARRIYNTDVTNYNTKIHIVPFNIIATIFRFKDADLFQIEDSKVRNNIDVNF